MTVVEQWQLDNDRYLSAALRWIRLRLLRLAKDASAEISPSLAVGGSASTIDRFIRRRLSKVPASMPVLTLPKDSDKQIRELETEMRSLENGDSPPALIALRRQLGLSRFESHVLLLCAAMELDTRMAGLCARAQDDPQRPYPTFALALALFEESAWETLAPNRPLRYWRLIEINQPGSQALTSSALRADERIVHYLKGLNTLDDRLATFISPMDMTLISDEALPPSQEVIVDEIIQRWQRVPDNSSSPIAQLVGPDVIGKQLIAAHTAAAFGRYVYRLAAESLPAQVNDLETLARLWQRESSLLPLALFLDAQEVDGTLVEHTALVRRFLEHADGVLFLSTRESWLQLPRANFSLDTSKPTTAEQRDAWNRNLGEKLTDTAGRLTAQFDLNVTTIAEAAQAVLREKNKNDDDIEQKLWTICLSITRPRLDALAQRLDPKATWGDLVLPEEQTALLRQISRQVRLRHTVYEDWAFAEKTNRGLGISVLFAGDSGTGKTMAAEVIANELKLNLYRIDLSAVVSKYIGETEKNLRRLFDAAEDGGAILFFDEADALFGKRTEVKDSHDRYANIEINYLLQRMESYRGLAILATNMSDSLDSAFVRRLRFIVNFPFPNAADRQLIWKKVFPKKIRKDKLDLDYERLGTFDISGGNIHNIALNAAFAAAQSNSKVTMPIVLSAMRTEYRKLDRPILEADFQ